MNKARTICAWCGRPALAQGRSSKENVIVAWKTCERCRPIIDAMRKGRG